MRFSLWRVAAGLALVASLIQPILTPGPGGDLLAVSKSEAEMQLEFGARVARMGSWREAAFRFRKAVQEDGTNPKAYNNLAVALEVLGRLDEAFEAYQKAIELDPENKAIAQNFERFRSYYHAGAGAGQ